MRSFDEIMNRDDEEMKKERIASLKKKSENSFNCYLNDLESEILDKKEELEDAELNFAVGEISIEDYLEIESDLECMEELHKKVEDKKGTFLK